MATGDVRFIPDRRAIRAIATDPGTTREILRAGTQLARYAQLGAPRRTGRGGHSIAASPSTQDRSAADVSWARRYAYMIFQEGGWRAGQHAPRTPGRHFLRRAFENYKHF